MESCTFMTICLCTFSSWHDTREGESELEVERKNVISLHIIIMLLLNIWWYQFARIQTEKGVSRRRGTASCSYMYLGNSASLVCQLYAPNLEVMGIEKYTRTITCHAANNRKATGPLTWEHWCHMDWHSQLTALEAQSPETMRTHVSSEHVLCIVCECQCCQGC